MTRKADNVDMVRIHNTNRASFGVINGESGREFIIYIARRGSP